MERSQDVQDKNPKIPESQNPVQDNSRPGYKHTSLGWIPEEWQVVQQSDVATFYNGKAYRQEELLANGKYRILRVGNFFTSTDWYYSNLELEDNKYVEDGDLMYAWSASFGPRFWKGEKTIYHYHIWKIDCKDCIEKLYFYHSLDFLTNKLKTKFANGMGIFHVTKADMEFATMLLPPKKEQRRIATILSTWDEAIAKTQQLIAQLQLRNKGLMQQLLTGKKRLKGFEKTKWNKINADAIFKSISIKNNDDEQLLSATQDRGIIPRDMLSGRVTMPSGETKSYKLVEPGNFIISLRSFQGGLEYSEYRGIVSPAYTVLKPIKPIDDSFYKYYFKSFDFIGHLAVAVIGIRDGKQISFDDFCVLRLPYPPIEEQKQIAAILSYADKEVKLHEQKLGILQQQKKGLMQKLLTGEVRVKIDNN